MRGSEGQEESPAQKIKSPVLISRRLILRLPHSEDIEGLVELANNRHISAMFDKMPYPFTRADAEAFVRRAEMGKIGYYVYAITCADTGAFMGCCGIGAYKGGSWLSSSAAPPALAGRERRHFASAAPESSSAERSAAGLAARPAAKTPAETEVFFWLGEPFWGKGYGEEVTIALIDVAFRATEIEALYARALTDNIAARKILRKCGFSLLQTYGHIGKDADKAETMAHYHLSREAWLELRSASSEPREKANADGAGSASA